MENTLLLNSGFEPIKIISWQKAITLLFLGKVEVVDNYEKEVRSISLAVKVPAVVRLLRYIHLGKRRPPLSRFNLLARDTFQCQYCQTQLSANTATIDHVLPKSQGGTTCWQNIVACCHACNRKKGGRTPHQARMNLRKDPIAPEWLPVLTINFNRNLPNAWLIFLANR